MSLLLLGPLGSGKTTRLLSEAVSCLNQHPAGSVLILCSNPARQQAFFERLLTAMAQPRASLPVYTYSGWVRTVLFDHWPWVEALLSPNPASPFPGQPVVMPELCGMEETEYLVRRLLQGMRTENPDAFLDVPGAEPAWVSQLIRRFRLRAENRLSRAEMARRDGLLSVPSAEAVAELERRLDRASYTLRLLDANKQLDVFHRLLEDHPGFQARMRERVRHLLVDDLDETTPAQQAFIDWLRPSLTSLTLAADPDGGSRRGYLNAFPYAWERFDLPQIETLTRTDAPAANAQTLLANWLQDVPDPLPHPEYFERHPVQATRFDMVEELIAQLRLRLETEPAGQFAVVFPKLDSLTLTQLRLGLTGFPLQVLAGTRVEAPHRRLLLTLLQLLNRQRWGQTPSLIELRRLLYTTLQEHDPTVLEAAARAVWAYPEGILPPELPVALAHPGRYAQLHHWCQRHQDKPLLKQLFAAVLEILPVTDQSVLSDIQNLVARYTQQQRLHMALGGDPLAFDPQWVTLARYGIVADSPPKPAPIDPNALLIATPQKLIDAEVVRPIHYWVDVSSREWNRTDRAPLYNAVVHSALWNSTAMAERPDHWDEDTWMLRLRAAHITRNLALLATERIHLLESETDDDGQAQTGLLTSMLPTARTGALLEGIQLRPDQAPIFDYTGGTMAVSAVPGAGKTFVNVALILKLIEAGTPPERMLVLTYMDSAAKTLQRRLRAKLDRLPWISTIHSLAFRILAQNDGSSALGFNTDEVTILDEVAKNALLEQVAAATQPEDLKSPRQWFSALSRGIQTAKEAGVTVEALEQYLRQQPGEFRLREFLPAYALYQQQLKTNALLDFTDLIVLAVQLLEQGNHPYQGYFQVILEDEAQDSSRLLQRFLTLLQSPNLIRTGDTNQSITTTFSAAEPAVFREFIANADHRVQMDQSGRCAEAVMAFANAWVTHCSQDPALKDAFSPVAMRPVPGQNPPMLTPIAAFQHTTEADEHTWLIEHIAQAREQYPEKTFAVLVRQNQTVAHLTQLLQDARIPAVGGSEPVHLKPALTTIQAVFQLLLQPDDMTAQDTLMAQLVTLGLWRDPEPLLTERALLTLTPAQLLSEAEQDATVQLYFDLLDMSRSVGTVPELVVQASERFLKTAAFRSVGYALALKVREWLQQSPADPERSPLECVCDHLQRLIDGLRRHRRFELPAVGPGFVQVMTLHKSKGQEFDLVWLPGLTTWQFPETHEQLITKEKAFKSSNEQKLLMALEKMARGGQLPDDYEYQQRRMKLEEEARLLYVGVTRARQGLFLSTFAESRLPYGNKTQPHTPARLWVLATAQATAEKPTP
jgi:DNA helicase-2/ATP-dependent DNA helicase PcrA